MMIGTREALRSSRHRSRPSPSGSVRSRRTRSGGWRAKRARASETDRAATTSKPCAGQGAPEGIRDRGLVLHEQDAGSATHGRLDCRAAGAAAHAGLYRSFAWAFHGLWRRGPTMTTTPLPTRGIDDAHRHHHPRRRGPARRRRDRGRGPERRPRPCAGAGRGRPGAGRGPHAGHPPDGPRRAPHQAQAPQARGARRPRRPPRRRRRWRRPAPSPWSPRWRRAPARPLRTRSSATGSGGGGEREHEHEGGGDD